MSTTITIPFSIRLLEPAIFDSPEGEPNSAVSHPYIPGSVIRGALIGLYLHTHPEQEFSAADPDIQRLFFDGQTRYMNANIVTDWNEQRYRTLPAPLSWQRPKDDKTSITDTAAASEKHDNTPMKSLKQGFVWGEGNQVQIQPVSRTLNIHTQRPRGKQSDPDQRRRALLFRYDALTRGQQFMGMIHCSNETDAQKIRDLIEGNPVIAMGGARSAGYGRAEIWLDNNIPVIPTYTNAKKIIVTLLSDTILRDANGQHTPTLNTLLQALKAKGISAPQENIVGYLDTTLVGGFNRKWGLPLPQTPALRAGSVLVMESTRLPSDEILDDLMTWGIGERCAEGFGEIAINWQNTQTAKYEVADKSRSELPLPFNTDYPASEAATLLREHVQARLNTKKRDTLTVKEVYRDERPLRRLPSRTQLGRLRRLIADELRNPNSEGRVLEKFLEDIKGKHAGKAFEAARIGDQSLWKWLETLQGEALQEMKDQPQSGAAMTLRYVDTLLERMQKEARHDDDN